MPCRHDGAVVPRVPQPAHDVDELGRDLVTQVVLVEALLAEVQRGGIVRARDHVPGGSPAAEMVERREAAGDVERFAEARGDGRAEPDVRVTMPSAASSVIGSKRLMNDG